MQTVSTMTTYVQVAGLAMDLADDRHHWIAHLSKSWENGQKRRKSTFQNIILTLRDRTKPKSRAWIITLKENTNNHSHTAWNWGPVGGGWGLRPGLGAQGEHHGVRVPMVGREGKQLHDLGMWWAHDHRWFQHCRCGRRRYRSDGKMKARTNMSNKSET